jgi:glycosyltransferase involved in cell wall biosynthesis
MRQQRLQQLMRILVLGPLPPPYAGPEVMTEALLSGLRPIRDLHVRHINTQVSRSVRERGGQYQARKSLGGIRQALRLVWDIIVFRPQIVYFPLTNSRSYLGFLRDSLFFVPALLLRCRVIVRLHGSYYFYSSRRGLQRWWLNILMKQVALVMVQGQRGVGCFDGLVPPERIAIIPNGIDDQPFLDARRRLAPLSLRPKLKRVLFVGTLLKEKGFRDIIAAVPNVPAAEFVFAGEWPSSEDEREVIAYLAEQHVSERVRFAGVVTGVAKYDLFASSDIFAFPSYYPIEGHAVSTVEALAAGLPIVGTDHGAINESLRDGWNGYFVPHSNPEAIASRLNQLVMDDEQRHVMSLRSRQLYEDRFTLAAFIQNWRRALQGGVETSEGRP